MEPTILGHIHLLLGVRPGSPPGLQCHDWKCSVQQGLIDSSDSRSMRAHRGPNCLVLRGNRRRLGLRRFGSNCADAELKAECLDETITPVFGSSEPST